jgi:predicted nucleotidyltransferase
MKTISEIALQAKDRNAIAAATTLLKERFPVVRVILFGSKATGRDDRESDIDLLVLTARKLDWRERDAITDSLFDVEMANDVVISTLVLPVEEWEHGPYSVLPIRDEVDREGVAVVACSPGGTA